MADENPKVGELQTLNYGWTKPNVMGSDDIWGGQLNADLDGIDSVVHGIDTRPPYVLPTASTTVLGGVKVDGSTITIAGGVITGTPSSGPPVTISATPPSSPSVGALWWDSVGGQLYVWFSDANSSQWVIAVNSGGGSGGGASITIGDIAPTTPSVGSLWFDSVGGQLYVWFNDGTSSQWVPTTNQFGGGYQPSKGVVDGSDAAPGQLGEYISATQSSNVAMTSGTAVNIVSINLTPGDWDVEGNGSMGLSSAVGQTVVFAISTVSATLPPASTYAGYTQLNVSPASLSFFRVATGMVRVSITATTAIYLIGFATFGAATCNGNGFIRARRAR